MLRTRRREGVLMEACLTGKTKFVVDNTNLSLEERARFIPLAKAAGFQVVGYFFESQVTDAIRRNFSRQAGEQIPPIAIHNSVSRLVPPSAGEGFDQLFFVRIAGRGGFRVEKWSPRKHKSEISAGLQSATEPKAANEDRPRKIR